MPRQFSRPTFSGQLNFTNAIYLLFDYNNAPFSRFKHACSCTLWLAIISTRFRKDLFEGCETVIPRVVSVPIGFLWRVCACASSVLEERASRGGLNAIVPLSWRRDSKAGSPPGERTGSEGETGRGVSGWCYGVALSQMDRRSFVVLNATGAQRQRWYSPTDAGKITRLVGTLPSPPHSPLVPLYSIQQLVPFSFSESRPIWPNSQPSWTPFQRMRTTPYLVMHPH